MADKPYDDFTQYYTEKLWEMIPSIYRHEDGLAEKPGVLRAIVEVLAEQAAILRRSQDRLWEDQFIELCDAWAVPYLADLVGTRLVSAKDPRGQRIDVAKTIYYRRRKGTLRVLEELISDITGWEGRVVEEFRRLGRTRHGLDPHPAPLASPVSHTPPGGWADLRKAHAAQLVDSPFDEFHHTPDMRRHRGKDGRYGIPKLAFHLYRLAAFRLEDVTPWQRPGNSKCFTFDPSGRDIPLFMPRNRTQDPKPKTGRLENWDLWSPAQEWQLPAPLRCRLLSLPQKPSQEDLELAQIIKDTLLGGENCALEVKEPGKLVQPDSILAANLEKWPVLTIDTKLRLAVDPERGRLYFLGAQLQTPVSVTYHYGFSGAIGAGTYSRPAVEGRPWKKMHKGGGELKAADIENEGVVQINDSATYGPIGDKDKVQDMTLQAANLHRPYLRLAKDWILTGIANANLLLDGIWLGSTAGCAVILRGDLERVTIRSCTFDPGGQNAAKQTIPSLPLQIEGRVETLVIERSIMGPIVTENNGSVKTLCVSDSIIHSIHPDKHALSLPKTEADLLRVTVLGKLELNRLWASETLITGLAEVTDTQNGCFRFSAAPEKSALEKSRLPRQYESHVLLEGHQLFTSEAFGQPGYCQLSESAPMELQRGAENGSEIGAFGSLLNPIKLDSLRAKVDEYMPFGLIPIYIYET